MSRRWKLSVLGVVLLAVAASATAVALAPDEEPDGTRTETRSRPAEAPRPEVLVVRRRGGVPRSWARRLGRMRGVTAVAWTVRAQALLDTKRAGYAIPLDTLLVQPRAYANVLPQAGPEFRRLRSGTALLSRTSARLRKARTGDRLRLAGGRELRVAGVVPDEVAGLAELVLTGGGNPSTRQLLVATRRPGLIERRFKRNDAVRVRMLAPTLRTTPGLVARPLETKARFGEFAVALPYGSDWIRIEPRWVDRNIISRSVPILGTVTCNRRLIAPLRRALRALERRRLSRVVDRADYAGCFAPRRIPGSGSLSLHAWGLAIDINAAANPRLGRSRQDRRLVRAMEEAGFTWGGRWPTVPDPMHFELHP